MVVSDAVEMETYKKKTNTGDPVFVRVQEHASHAPTVLLLGWFGAQHRHILKYATLYESLGYSTVSTIAPTSVVFSLNHRNVPRFLLSLLRILRSDSRLTRGGLVIHAFSNGGAMFLPALSRMFCGLHRDTIGPDDESAVSTVKNSLSAVVFDSGPAYLHHARGAEAFRKGLDAQEGSALAWMLFIAFHIFLFFQRLLLGDVPRRFWDSMRNARYGAPEIYFYSCSDDLIDADLLEALVKERRENECDEVDVREWKVDNALHCQLLRRFPDEYFQKLQGVNEWGVNRFRLAHGLEEWPMR